LQEFFCPATLPCRQQAGFSAASLKIVTGWREEKEKIFL
jgi:hypothetical protein